jgi:hypothetical protein
MTTTRAVELSSGCTIERPYDRLLAFCHGEYIYYDAIPSRDPSRIDPLDVLVTVAMNSFVNSAVKVQLLPGTESKAKAADVAMEALRLFRGDLLEARGEIEALKEQLARAGFQLTPVRVLELLVWTQTEPAGNYRSTVEA